MRHAIHRYCRAALLGCLIVCSAVATPGLAAESGPATAAREASTKTWAVILDPQIPLATRQQALAGLEQGISNDDQHELYLLGSLYYMGKHASGALVEQDLAKADVYMGNAAIHGSLFGMAKMAEIDLAVHKYPEAMIWAQVYAHYAMLLPKHERPSDGYTAELVQRIIDKLGSSGVTQAMPEVANFIAVHDAAIHAGTDSNFNGERPRPAGKRKTYLTPNYRFAPKSGIADYLLAFNADGSEAHA